MGFGWLKFCLSSHLSGKLALVQWCTHPENRNLSTDPSLHLHDVLHLIDSVTDGLIGHSAVLLGDWGALLPVDCGADLSRRRDWGLINYSLYCNRESVSKSPEIDGQFKLNGADFSFIKTQLYVILKLAMHQLVPLISLHDSKPGCRQCHKSARTLARWNI